MRDFGNRRGTVMRTWKLGWWVLVMEIASLSELRKGWDSHEHAVETRNCIHPSSEACADNRSLIEY